MLTWTSSGDPGLGGADNHRDTTGKPTCQAGTGWIRGTEFLPRNFCSAGSIRTGVLPFTPDSYDPFGADEIRQKREFFVWAALVSFQVLSMGLRQSPPLYSYLASVASFNQEPHVL